MKRQKQNYKLHFLLHEHLERFTAVAPQTRNLMAHYVIVIVMLALAKHY